MAVVEGQRIGHQTRCFGNGKADVAVSLSGLANPVANVEGAHVPAHHVQAYASRERALLARENSHAESVAQDPPCLCTPDKRERVVDGLVLIGPGQPWLN